ncbi:Flp pilus assembly complex ATPase component TadA [Candidatus Micrarchaeota archaeon]|nr:Flp pilus assembly complex ATPase component TadA [Candidatus Micrarchaeota archaeon]
MKEKTLASYFIEIDKAKLEVNIMQKEKAFVRFYFLNLPELGTGTKALLKNLKTSLITDATIKAEKMMDPKFIKELKEKFRERAETILSKELPDMDEKIKEILIVILLQEMLGLGKIEFLLEDPNLEEIVVNASSEPVWIYHRTFGWLKTNILIKPEEEIQNYASIIARRIGKQISVLNPLLDAHLITGDRANATLFPISSKGNTLTIRRFRRDPWTLTDFIENRTVNAEIMALLWMAIEYELNIMFSGGTGSGKTSFLNVCMPFIQPNNRILSIEDTREIQLPEYLHWVPLTTREPNPEGKGGVCLYPGTWFVTGDGEINEIAEYVESRLKQRPTEKIESNVLVAEGKQDCVIAGDPKKFSYQAEKIKIVSRVTERKYVCEIECENGETISLTENTKLPVVGMNGKIELLKPQEIKQGDYYLPAFSEINLKGSIQEIDAIKIFGEGEFYAVDKADLFSDLIKEQSENGLTLKEIANKCGIKRQAFNWYKKTGIVRLPVLKKLVEESKIMNLEQLEKEISVIKARGQGAKHVRIPKQIDEDLVYLAGFILAEKSLSKNGIHIVQKDELPELEHLVKKIFNVEIIHKKFAYNYYRILSQIIMKIMKEVFGATKSKLIRVPKCIMRSTNEVIAAFLAGYIDGDGTVGKRRVSLATGNKEAAIEFKYLLTRLGIWSRIQKAKRAWIINVCTREDVVKACKKIEFRLEKNRKKAEEIKNIKYSHNTKRNRVPALLLHNYMKSLMQSLSVEEKRKHLYHASYNKTSVPKGYLQKILLQAKLSEEEIQNIELFLREDLEFVKITDVKITPNEKNIPSYDVTPENSTYFVAGINNLTLVMDTMLDLLVNSLRMRPDRIIVGEIRREREAEVMFEAMHTGHSVYTTVHANTAEETIRRLVNPPINIPVSMLDSVHLNVVMFRNRRMGTRRVLQVAELIPEKRGGGEELVKVNVLYRWKASVDEIGRHSESIRLFDELSLHTGFTIPEINEELKSKQEVVEWLMRHKIKGIEKVGKLMAQYYMDKDSVMELVNKNKKPEFGEEIGKTY